MEKKLTRSTDDRMIAGVAAGVAEYLNIDPVLVRILFVLLALAGGPGVLIYLVLWLVMPQTNSNEKTDSE
ncbi:MAG: PspC domain-containing protein [Chloroflexi bacterium]|nr:PspC domain-containing protein [Chloroflexota bacterium]